MEKEREGRKTENEREGEGGEVSERQVTSVKRGGKEVEINKEKRVSGFNKDKHDIRHHIRLVFTPPPHFY